MFNPVEHYKFAGQLYDASELEQQEATIRTIINRSYYSVFLCGRNVANIKNSNASVHQEVIDYFEKRSDLNIVNQLKQLRDLRTKADYHTDDIIQRRDAGKSLKFARHILTQLKILP